MSLSAQEERLQMAMNLIMMLDEKDGQEFSKQLMNLACQETVLYDVYQARAKANLKF